MQELCRRGARGGRRLVGVTSTADLARTTGYGLGIGEEVKQVVVEVSRPPGDGWHLREGAHQAPEVDLVFNEDLTPMTPIGKGSRLPANLTHQFAA